MRILVTGGSSGIGAALALSLIGKGDDVWTLSRRRAPGHWLECDLTRPETFPDVANALPMLDAVIHSAGIWEATAFSPGYDFATRSVQEVLDIIAVNLTAPILLTQALLTKMNTGARIVLVGSTSGLDRIGTPEVAYSASKAGLRGAAQALQVALKGRHPVTLINPGDVATEREADDLIPVADVVRVIRLALDLSPGSYVPELTIEPTG